MQNGFCWSRYTGTGSEVSYSQDGVTFTCDKAYGDGTYGIRCYAGATIEITATKKISTIEMEFPTVNDKTYDGGLESPIKVNATSWNSGALASQARLNGNLVINFAGEGEEEEEEEEEEETSDKIVISGLQYVDAYYADGYWDFDFYKNLTEDYEYVYPDVYFMCEE